MGVLLQQFHNGRVKISGRFSTGQLNGFVPNTRVLNNFENAKGETNEPRSAPPLILLIENDQDDVFLVRRALAHAGWKGDLRGVGSATEAWNYMEGRFPFDDRSYFRIPQLIVSDYRLAGHTALEFCAWLRSQSQFADIPIVMLSGLASGLNAEKLERVCAKGFIPKTGDIVKLAQALKPFLP